jgi:hypothetical protein
MRSLLLALLLVYVGTTAISGQAVAPMKGQFYGKLILVPQPDGRNMLVQDRYGYEDSLQSSAASVCPYHGNWCPLSSIVSVRSRYQ